MAEERHFAEDLTMPDVDEMLTRLAGEKRSKKGLSKAARAALAEKRRRALFKKVKDDMLDPESDYNKPR